MQGRPTKYKPEYDDLVLQEIGEKGLSIAQFARNLRVSRMSIYEWAEVHPSFSDALTRAKEWSEAHWEDRFVNEFMTDNKVNAPLVKLYYTNRFKWSDKGESESDDKAQPLNISFEVRDPVGTVKVTNAKPE